MPARYAAVLWIPEAIFGRAEKPGYRTGSSTVLAVGTGGHLPTLQYDGLQQGGTHTVYSMRLAKLSMCMDVYVQHIVYLLRQDCLGLVLCINGVPSLYACARLVCCRNLLSGPQPPVLQAL